MATLQRIFAGMERRKANYIEDASRWPAQALLYRGQDSAWCALDILDHLIRTEMGIAQRMLSNMASPKPLSSGDRVRGTMMLALFYSPMRVKVPPAAAAVLPQTPTDLAQVVEDWNRTRSFVARVVERFEKPGASTISGGVFQHPVAGWMSPATTMRFLDSHLAHHLYQWKRLRRSAWM